MRMSEDFKDFNLSEKGTLAVAAADDAVVIKTVCQAKERGFADSILCGNKEKIKEIARNAQLDISSFEIVNTDTEKEAARVAVSLVKQKRANMLMKGMLQTADVLRAVG